MLLNLVYAVTLFLVSPVLLYGAWRKGKYRTGWSQKLWGNVPHATAAAPKDTAAAPKDTAAAPKDTAKQLWIHAVSVGEVNLAAGLAEELQKLSRLTPGAGPVNIVVSTTTVTGFDLAKKRFPKQTVFYCPLDFTWAIRKAIHRIQPDLIVLIELEIWPNWLRIAKHMNVPVAVVNGRLSDKSFRGYQRLRYLLHPTFRRLSLVAAQDDTYAHRFGLMGVPQQRIKVTGSLKFDDAPLTRDCATVKQFRRLAKAEQRHVIFLAGSTQAGEERTALQVFKTLSSHYPQLRLVLVPRHADRFDEVADEIKVAGFHCRRRSEMNTPPVQPTSGVQPTSASIAELSDAPQTTDADTSWHANQVLLIDTIGELRGWWGLADIAFVGGSLGSRGGQNMLEPAGYGAAVCFGPNTKNFRDIVHHLLAAKAACVVGNGEELRDFIQRMIESPDLAEQMGSAAQQVVISHQGARKKTAELLLQLCASPHPISQPNQQ